MLTPLIEAGPLFTKLATKLDSDVDGLMQMEGSGLIVVTPIRMRKR